jgi:hypothetical protein
VKNVSIVPFLEFECTTIAHAINCPIKCPTIITFLSKILHLSSLCCNLIPKEFLHLFKIYHNESLSDLNKTNNLIVPYLLLETSMTKNAKKITQIYQHEITWKNIITLRCAKSTCWTTCIKSFTCSSKIWPSMANCSPFKSTPN